MLSSSMKNGKYYEIHEGHYKGPYINDRLMLIKVMAQLMIQMLVYMTNICFKMAGKQKKTTITLHLVMIFVMICNPLRKS